MTPAQRPCPGESRPSSGAGGTGTGGPGARGSGARGAPTRGGYRHDGSSTSQDPAPDDPRAAEALPDRTGPEGPDPHDGYRHDALLYRGIDGFLAATVPFVRDGLADRQPVMVAAIPDRLEPLRTALGPDAAGVRFVDMAALGRNPSRIIPAWRRFVDEIGADGRSARGIGEPIWAGRRPVELVECQLHEALLNLAVEPTAPLWLLCPYDADALDGSVIEAAHRSHPAITDGYPDGGHRASPGYGGVDHARALFGGALPEPTSRTTRLPFGAGDLPAVRGRVTQLARAAKVSPERVAVLAWAVGELAANSVLHGGGQGVLRVWRDFGALVCEVRDSGHIDDPLVGRRLPPAGTDSGRGLWLVNQVCDLMQLRSTPEGTAVRVVTWV